MGKRLAYYLAGYGVGVALWFALELFIGKHRMLSVLLIANPAGILIGYWAERTGRVKSIAELNRPLTLFPRD